MRSTRAWLVFAGGVLAYVVGVTQRTSFGVLGVEATDRFDITAAALSTVSVLQIVVYASLQIPVGLLVDRIGPKALILSGAAIMAAGSVLLAFAPNLGVAIVARVLVGVGDAATFVSVIRVLPNWFGGRLLPQLTQWVGSLGQVGQLLSAVPFALLLASVGWQPSLLVLSALSLVVVLVVAVVVGNGEPPPLTSPIPTGGPVRHLLAAIRRPGTQLGFWAHLVGGTAPTVMALMWGYPYLTGALDLPVGVAAAVMSAIVIGNVVGGPTIGFLVARYPLRRSTLVLVVAVLVYGVWAAVLLWPGTPPVAMVAVLYFMFGVGGPGSLIGFDIARTFNPSHVMGTASGFVNVGGFLGGFLSVFGIGVVLDLLDHVRVAAGGASDLYGVDSFRIAFLVPFAIVTVGVVGLLVSRRRTRRGMREEGIEIAPLWVSLYRWRRARRRPTAD